MRTAGRLAHGQFAGPTLPCAARQSSLPHDCVWSILVISTMITRSFGISGTRRFGLLLDGCLLMTMHQVLLVSVCREHGDFRNAES